MQKHLIAAGTLQECLAKTTSHSPRHRAHIIKEIGVSNELLNDRSTSMACTCQDFTCVLSDNFIFRTPRGPMGRLDIVSAPTAQEIFVLF